MLNWLTSHIRSFVNHPYILLIGFIATLIGGIAAIDYFFPTALTTISNFLRELIILWKPLLGIAIALFAIWIIHHFWQKRKFVHAYLRHIVYEHRVFNIKGLRTRGTYTIELDQVFVELRIAPSTTPNRSRRALLSIEELQGNQPIWEFLRYGRKSKRQLLLAIIGTPGCGKTTLLQHVALQFATKVPYGLPKWIPILLFLRQHVKTILTDKLLLAELIQQYFADPKRYPDLEPPAKWFHQQLQAGKCLVLLDGLDEVANAEERKQISAWIDEQIVNYPRCVFIVTSRPQGYHAAPLSRATLLEVQSFTAAQVRQFIEGWYLVTEIMSFGGKDDVGVRLRAKQEAEDLQQRLHSRPVLMELSVNPLLLTMIAMVHRYRGQLPGRRVELYAEICDVLLGHWRNAKGIPEKLSAAQKRVALQPLAAQMMIGSLREIEITTAIRTISKPLRTIGITSDLKNFLQDIEVNSGLFSEREIGIWSFAHLTFQEYLASVYLKERRNIDNQWWYTKVADSWWHETLRLYAAQTDATLIVKACLLHKQNVTTLTLAADCLEEALKLDHDVRQLVEEQLIMNLGSNDSQLFKLAVEVKLQRRLKNMQRIDDGNEIDLTFISCAEYQLFLNEMREKGKFYQPDHWSNCHFTEENVNQPIIGIRASDAIAFCNWLSKREKKKYRCPTLEESQEYQATEGNHQIATWCQSKHFDWSLQWNMPKQENVIKENLKRLFGKNWVDRNIEYINVSDCALALDRNYDRTFTRTLASVYAHDHYFNNIAVALALARDLESALDLKLDRNFEHNFTHNLDLSLVSIMIKDFSIDTVLPQNFSNIKNTIDIQQHLQTFQPRNIAEQRSKQLLTELLIICTTHSYLKQRQAWRRYIAYLAEYALFGYKELEKENDNRSWWQRLILWKKGNNYIKEKEKFALLYMWAHIVNARQEGKLEAWESIRIVREQKSSE